MKVLFYKVDMDTSLTAFVLGVSEKDELVPLQGDASPDDLANPKILCIEVGGSGQTELNNFDHHDPTGPIEPACRQAYQLRGGNDCLARLVDYVSLIDLEGSKVVPEVEFPSLNQMFSGMLLCTTMPSDQLHKGVQVFSTLLSEGIDPFGTMPQLPEWQQYIEAKKQNIEKAREVRGEVTTVQSKSGLSIGFLQSEHMGAVGIIYGLGCQIAVVCHPHFGYRPERKFTIAGNDIRVSQLIPIFNSVEPGWGGSATGTIIGSPRGGSKLTLSQVVELVKQNI
jgi:hypothetical protein